MTTVQSIALGLLVLIYAGSGLIEIPLWRKSVDRFVGWGYPSWMAILNPVLKAVAGVLALIPQTRLVGVLLCAAIGIAASATVLKARDTKMYGPAFTGTALTLICAGLVLY
jgi:hypothetical protein